MEELRFQIADEMEDERLDKCMSLLVENNLNMETLLFWMFLCQLDFIIYPTFTGHSKRNII